MTKLWFKAKRYGWGWFPSTWQGWVIVLVYILIVFGATKLLPNVLYLEIVIAVSTILLLLICYKTGEKPRWRWGKH